MEYSRTTITHGPNVLTWSLRSLEAYRQRDGQSHAVAQTGGGEVSQQSHATERCDQPFSARPSPRSSSHDAKDSEPSPDSCPGQTLTLLDDSRLLELLVPCASFMLHLVSFSFEIHSVFTPTVLSAPLDSSVFNQPPWPTASCLSEPSSSERAIAPYFGFMRLLIASQSNSLGLKLSPRAASPNSSPDTNLRALASASFPSRTLPTVLPRQPRRIAASDWILLGVIQTSNRVPFPSA